MTEINTREIATELILEAGASETTCTCSETPVCGFPYCVLAELTDKATVTGAFAEASGS